MIKSCYPHNIPRFTSWHVVRARFNLGNQLDVAETFLRSVWHSLLPLALMEHILDHVRREAGSVYHMLI